MNIMNNIGLTYAPKSINILDMGTHFGFVPHFLKSKGFNCAYSTNSYKEAGDNLEELKHMEDVRYRSNRHILKNVLRYDKYDIIFMNMSNILEK